MPPIQAPSYDVENYIVFLEPNLHNFEPEWISSVEAQYWDIYIRGGIE